jgi:ABC-type transport system substrate-binding protein
MSGAGGRSAAAWARGILAMRRRAGGVLAAWACAALLIAASMPAPAQPAAAAAPAKVLRYAFPAAETGFDPVQVSDLYSSTVNSHLFDALYTYDYLARPFKIRPNTAVGMPEVSADFRTWTVRIQPGIYFADDPAFKGQRRELVAEDYVYTVKRYFDPATKSPAYSTFAEQRFLGLTELREEAQRSKQPFDYDRPVEGIRALDRYTLQIRLAEPRPRLIYLLAVAGRFPAMAREVVEFYGDKVMEHPVGTGPFRLAGWRRSSKIVLERNPGFRELRYDAEPNADDAEGQALLAKLKGRRLPMVDRVEVSIIEESQPRWLAFVNEEFDLTYGVPLEFAQLVAPNDRLAPNLAKRGVQMFRSTAPDRTLYYFNMEDPLIGGYTPDRVALRRAIGLATDVGREIRVVRRGQAIPAQSAVAPGTWGYDPAFRTENGVYDLARAKALLDLYGYVDRDGDGWREQPDGKPLVLQLASQPDSLYRAFDELWKKDMDALGLRLAIKSARWPENLKAARAGQLMIWSLGYTATSPDSQDALQLLYSKAAGQNLPRFRNERYDRLFERMQSLPDGPEREALLREALKIVVAYMPHKYSVHRIVTDLAQPWLIGYRRPAFNYQFWQYVDVEAPVRP